MLSAWKVREATHRLTMPLTSAKEYVETLGFLAELEERRNDLDDRFDEVGSCL